MPAKLFFRADTSIIVLAMSDKRQLKYAFLSNLRVPMVLKQKMQLVLNNTWTKIHKVRGCCGNYGQPGC